MSVSSASSLTGANTGTNAATASEGKKKGALTQEDFLNLLMTQMRFQNPLEPMDSYQMASQMAQLSTVEAMNQMTQSIKNLEENQASSSALQSMGLVGKKVEVQGNVVSLDGGKASEASYQLTKPGKVKVDVYHANGTLVRTFEEGVKDASRHPIVWDGKGQKGGNLPDGEYLFRVTATDEKGQAIDASTFMKGTVSGVTFENGIPYLQIGSQKIPLKNVSAILS
jgi:flagellar basal-body rod modification protein FlgD